MSGQASEPPLFRAAIDPERCLACALCQAQCPAQAIYSHNGRFSSGPDCLACASCLEVCPAEAIVMKRRPEKSPAGD